MIINTEYDSTHDGFYIVIFDNLDKRYMSIYPQDKDVWKSEFEAKKEFFQNKFKVKLGDENERKIFQKKL